MGPIGIILSARHKHSTPAGKSIKHTHSPKQRHIHALSYFSKYAVPSRPIYKAGACNSAASLDPTSGPLHPKQTHPHGNRAALATRPTIHSTVGHQRMLSINVSRATRHNRDHKTADRKNATGSHQTTPKPPLATVGHQKAQNFGSSGATCHSR